MKPLMASVIRLGALAILLAFVMLLRPCKAVTSLAAPNNNLTAGSTLKPPSYITSPDGIFAFGFRALDSDPTKFILATWFLSDAGNEPQPQSVVWFAKQSPSGPTPVATAESVLSITVNGQLALTGSGKQKQVVLWRVPQTPSLKRGSVLTLRDSGNLQLLGPGGGGADDNVLWQSFWYPTDTLLPGQSLAMDPRSEGKLFSKRADAEFTTGRFSMGVQTDGNIVLYIDLLTGNSPSNAYWQAYIITNDGNTTIIFDDQGRLNYTLGNGTAGTLIIPPPLPLADSTAGDNNFLFARMDPDGVVRTYYRPKNGGGMSWTMSGYFPSEGCNKWTSGLQGMCGPGSYCVESPERLNCLCPSGYTYTDDQHKDEGCTPQFVPQTCGSGGDSDDHHDWALVELPRTTWAASIYYKKLTSVTEEQCRNYCLSDCSCAAALVIGGSDCVEVAVLTNGRQTNDATRKALVKVRVRTAPDTRRMPYKVVTICLASLLAISSVATAITCKLWQGYADSKAKRRALLGGGLINFTYKELDRATNGFKVLLGKGAFGEVYKGEVSYLKPPHRHVAVKKLVSHHPYSGRDFQNEVQSVGQIHHKYLVRMLGYYCQEGVHRGMLVYECLQGGTLKDFIFGPKRPCWSCIAEAAIGIAKGLEYLHEGCKSQIFHCDIKPDNILFDDMHTPKITDFGIARLLGDQKTQHTITKTPAGTKAYAAPEWLDGDGKVDNKVDVYSFGVMLLQMICCRKEAPPAPAPAPGGQPNEDQGTTLTLRAWVESQVRRGQAEVLVHGESEALADMESVERFARVALWCSHNEPSARPRMRKVVQMLEGAVEVDPLPGEPPRLQPLSLYGVHPDGNGSLNYPSCSRT